MKKIILIITILIALITSILPTTVLASDTLFEYYNSGYDNIQKIGYQSGDYYVGGQTFTPQVTHNLTSVKLKLFRSGAADGARYNCFLFATSGGLPTGSYLRYTYIYANSVTTNTNGEWVEFVFPSSYKVNAGTKYAILLGFQVGSGAAESVSLWWQEDVTSPTYTGGNKILSMDGFVTFDNYYGTDMQFETYGTYPPAVPSIVPKDASDITQYEAKLNATVSNDGYEACDVRFGYGTTSKAKVDFEDYDTVTDWVNDYYTTGMNVSVNVDSLDADTTYYYRVQIKNSAGTATSDEISFTTLDDFTAPVNFRAVTESTVINLFWVKGTGASTTMIRYSYGSYPTSTTDGILLYSGTGSNTTHTGLTSGSTVYYTAWSVSGVDISEGVNLLATTTIQEEGDVDLTKPTTPVNWFIDIDPTTMENFEPVYSMMNDIADSIDMPHPTFWFLAATTMSVAGGVGVYSWKKSLLGAGIVMLVIMIVASAVHLIPGFMIFLVGLVIISIGTVARRFGT